MFLHKLTICTCYCYCRLEFGSTEVNGEEVKTNDILAMLSPEKEKVPLQKVTIHHVILMMMMFHHGQCQGLKARGNVEQWLTLVEESMVTSLRRITKAAITDYDTKPRHEWATCHPSQVGTHHEQQTEYNILLQVVLSVSQLMWCKDLTTCLTSDDIMEQVKQAEQRCFQVTDICKMMLFYGLLYRILTGWQSW